MIVRNVNLPLQVSYRWSFLVSSQLSLLKQMIMTLFEFTIARDVLYELAYVGNLPLPRPSPGIRNKRGRDSDEPNSRSTTYDSPSSSTASTSGRHSSEDVPSPQMNPAVQKLEHEQILTDGFYLPMYTDELGRLPLHGQFNLFSDVKPPPASLEFAGQSNFPTSYLPNNSQFMANPTSPPYETSNASLFGVPSATVPTTFMSSLGVDPPALMQGHELRQSWNTGIDPSSSLSSTTTFDVSRSMPNPAYDMWSNAPATFGYVKRFVWWRAMTSYRRLVDWGMYMSNVSADPTPVGSSYNPEDH